MKRLFVCLLLVSFLAGCGDSNNSSTTYYVVEDASLSLDGFVGDVVIINDAVVDGGSVAVDTSLDDTSEEIGVSDTSMDSADVMSFADAPEEVIVSDTGMDSIDVISLADVPEEVVVNDTGVDSLDAMFLADVPGVADSFEVQSDLGEGDGVDTYDVISCLNGCDDGDLCTDDICVDDVCQHTTIESCCVTVNDCVNNDACQIVSCVNNVCTLTQFDCPYGCTDGVCDMCATDNDCVFPLGYVLPSPSSLVAFWSFDSSDGTTVNDDSGNGHDATFLVNEAPVFGPGIVGRAYHNNGTGQLRVAHIFSLPVTTASLSLWMTFNNFTDDSEVVERLFGDNVDPHIYFDSSDDTFYIHYELDTVKMNCSMAQFSQSYVPNTWYHFVVTFDINVGVTAYINGEKICENTIMGTAFKGGTSQSIIAGGFQRYLNGSVDEIKAFNSALSENQVQALFLHPHMVVPNQQCACSDDGVSVCSTYTGTCLENKKCAISTTTLNDCGVAGCVSGYCGCSVEVECDDSDPCTLDSCLSGGCHHSMTDLCQ